MILLLDRLPGIGSDDACHGRVTTSCFKDQLPEKMSKIYFPPRSHRFIRCPGGTAAQASERKEQGEYRREERRSAQSTSV